MISNKKDIEALKSLNYKEVWKQAYERGKTAERKRIINELRKYSGEGDEYFAERDFDFICRIVNEEIKGETKE